MDCTKVAILFYGLSCNSTHYIGIFAPIFMRLYQNVKKKHIKMVTLCKFFWHSLMGPISFNATDPTPNEHEATKFNAEAHLSFMRQIFTYYNQSFDTWCLCLIGDNSATNLKVADLCNKPYVGCNSHKLNLEVNKMIENRST